MAHTFRAGVVGWILAFAVVLAATIPQPAAAAFVDVTAFLEAVPTFGIPDGITLSGGQDFLQDTRTFTGNESQTLTSREAVTVTNTSATPFTDGFDFEVWFSAFDCCDEVGLSIDNTKQSAAFSSTVEGPGVYDSHSCDLPAPNAGYVGDGYDFSPLTCGVVAPDVSVADIYVDQLSPGQTETFYYTMTISDRFSSVPEPSMLAILGPAVLGLGLFRRQGTVAGRAA
jgi:hypothetical protein